VIRFGKRCVHPFTVRSVFARHSEITEYQVRTTTRSLHASLVLSGPLDADRLAAPLAQSLGGAGARDISVTVAATDRLDRDPRTAKLPRFIAD
jgi:hypothetical protein